MLTENLCQKVGGSYKEFGIGKERICEINLPTHNWRKVDELVKELTDGKGEFIQYSDGVTLKIGNENFVAIDSPHEPTTLTIRETEYTITFKMRDSEIIIQKPYLDFALLITHDCGGWAEIELD